MRPHIATVASKHQVTGFCGNNESAVFIEVQGSADSLAAFETEVFATLPPLATVTHVARQPMAVVPEDSFSIVASKASTTQEAKTLIPPDATICADCLAELYDPRNRRYRYPFITCTNCGPRLSIIRSLPYDRPNTTMADFPLCQQCAAEYHDPLDRRYHAQPISCPDCGPRLWLQTPTGEVTDDPIAAAQRLIAGGGVIAVRGIGGFHIICDASNPQAVAKLRQRKNRPHKPLAVMVSDLQQARELVELSEETTKLLNSPAHPIVIAPARRTLDGIAPGLREIGVMLPYSPLHVLLVDRPLVATSANLSGEPLCWDNPTAQEYLLGTGMVDALLTHDRDIHVPVEDSIFRGSTLLRRSRGLAPLPVPISGGEFTVLAVGGELKNTFTVAIGDVGHVSGHIGDMGSLRSQQVFERGVRQVLTIQKVVPEAIVCDLHPDYATTHWAHRFSDTHDLPLYQVQHHHAHALSLLTEHQLIGTEATVIVADGTGYGTDNTIWGGEILDISATGDYSRRWHLPVFALAGFDRAIRFPWRQAVGLCHSLGIEWQPPVASAEINLVLSQLESGIGVVFTSSLGRLFDAAASILGLCHEVTFEAQAAMLLEQAAATANPHRDRPTSLSEIVHKLFNPSYSVAQRARDFHNDIAALLVSHLPPAVEKFGISGGCALNRLLIDDLRFHLNHPLLQHAVVPANDGGLSLGQAVAGRLQLGSLNLADPR